MTFLYDLMTFICTRYALHPGAPAMALYVNETYSNQPIFLFPEQNGRRFY
jgi:hypothetical protein